MYNKVYIYANEKTGIERLDSSTDLSILVRNFVFSTGCASLTIEREQNDWNIIPIQSLIFLTKFKKSWIFEIKVTCLEFTLYLCVVCILSAIRGLFKGENRGGGEGREGEAREEEKQGNKA